MQSIKHSIFIKHFLYEQLLPTKLESLKTFLLYFCITTMKLLKIDYEIQPILDYLKLLEVSPLIFRASTFDSQQPSIVNSYCGVAIYKQLNKEISSTQEQLEFVKSLLTDDYSIKSSVDSNDSDLRMVYSALAYLDLLNIKDQELNNKLCQFILKCQNKDGGFGLKPQLESHCGATFCAIASLTMLNIQVPNKSQLYYFLANKQCKLSGGISGRINKIADSCYSFWVKWTLKILQIDNFFDEKRLQEFLSQCEYQYGGYSKYPNHQPDPIHTLHSLLGIIESEQYDYIHAIIN